MLCNNATTLLYTSSLTILEIFQNSVTKLPSQFCNSSRTTITIEMNFQKLDDEPENILNRNKSSKNAAGVKLARKEL